MFKMFLISCNLPSGYTEAFTNSVCKVHCSGWAFGHCFEYFIPYSLLLMNHITHNLNPIILDFVPDELSL